MIKRKIQIKGMHCKSCEMLIEDALKDLHQIIKVDANFHSKTVTIYSKKPIYDHEIEKVINSVGYSIGIDEKKAFFSSNFEDYIDLLAMFFVALILYNILKNLGLFNLDIASSSSNAGLSIVFLIGLTAGVSTCMALVGGLVLSVAARHAEKHPEATTREKFIPHLFFNLGRIASYFVLGGVIGILGKAFQLSAFSLGSLILFVGFVMLVLGIKLTEISPRLNSLQLTLPKSLSSFFGIKKHHEKEYSHKNAALLGALTFFLPCGFTQAMQLYAISTGSFLQGSLIMAVFALGTAPGLLSIGCITSWVKGTFAKKFFRFAGVVVIMLASFNISNGYNLTGFNFFDFEKGNYEQSQTDPNVEIVDGAQVVNMTQNRFGYDPNQFIVQRGVPVKWVINSETTSSCAASLVFPSFNISKNLKIGENIIEFTPNQVGDFKFSCSMGMYRGKFIVVDGDDAIEENTNDENFDTDSNVNNGKASLFANLDDLQIIKTTYASYYDDIVPNAFTVQSGKPVRFEIDVKENGQGCMSTIMIPGLVNEPVFLEKGKTVTFDFTPTEKGTYDITCAMGVPRGTLTVQ